MSSRKLERTNTGLRSSSLIGMADPADVIDAEGTPGGEQVAKRKNALAREASNYKSLSTDALPTKQDLERMGSGYIEARKVLGHNVLALSLDQPLPPVVLEEAPSSEANKNIKHVPEKMELQENKYSATLGIASPSLTLPTYQDLNTYQNFGASPSIQSAHRFSQSDLNAMAAFAPGRLQL